MEDGNLYLLAGRPSMGKTVFALNLMGNVAVKNNKACLYFTLEDSSYKITEKLLRQVSETDIPYKADRLNEVDRNRIKEAADRLLEAPIIIEHEIFIDKIVEKAKRFVEENDIKLIIVDHLQQVLDEQDFCQKRIEYAIRRLENAVNEVLSEYLTEETRFYLKNFREALLGVGTTMNSVGYPQDNGLPQMLLKELITADEVFCEVPFCYKDDTELWNGVMDVVYCKDEKWHIVDYKTNIDGRGLDKKYESQLKAYKSAFKMMPGEEADAYTYHISV